MNKDLETQELIDEKIIQENKDNLIDSINKEE